MFSYSNIWHFLVLWIRYHNWISWLLIHNVIHGLQSFWHNISDRLYRPAPLTLSPKRRHRSCRAYTAAAPTGGRWTNCHYIHNHMQALIPSRVIKHRKACRGNGGSVCLCEWGCNVVKKQSGHISKANQISRRICFSTSLTLTISVFFCKPKPSVNGEAQLRRLTGVGSLSLNQRWVNSWGGSKLDRRLQWIQ